MSSDVEVHLCKPTVSVAGQVFDRLKVLTPISVASVGILVSGDVAGITLRPGQPMVTSDSTAPRVQFSDPLGPLAEAERALGTIVDDTARWIADGVDMDPVKDSAVQDANSFLAHLKLTYGAERLVNAGEVSLASPPNGDLQLEWERVGRYFEAEFHGGGIVTTLSFDGRAEVEQRGSLLLAVKAFARVTN